MGQAETREQMLDRASLSFGLLRFFHAKQAGNLPLLSGSTQKEGLSKPRHLYPGKAQQFPVF